MSDTNLTREIAKLLNEFAAIRQLPDGDPVLEAWLARKKDLLERVQAVEKSSALF